MRYLRFVLFLGLLAVAATLTNGAVVQAASTFTVDSTGDAVDANPGDGTCATAGAVCTLRAAIEETNALAGSDTINFNIPGAGPHTISPGSALPTITDPVTIDGYTQPGASSNTNPFELGSNAVLKIELDGTNAGADVDGLNITAGSSTVKGLVINRFEPWFDVGGDGIELSTNGNNTIEGNFIGTDVSGTVDLGNAEVGVNIVNAPSNTIGGTVAGARNVISGNFRGVFIYDSEATGNKVEGNYIGTDVSGTADLGNYVQGVVISDAPGNTIGGTAAGAGNVISGNGWFGIGIVSSGATGNVVQGNLIGTDANGTADLGNNLSGVDICDAPGNTIGGTAAGARNVISGNGHGVSIWGSAATGNVVQGNYIGTDVNGTADLGNFSNGVYFPSYASNNTIGGAAAGAGNTIAFNGGDGVYVERGTGNPIDPNSIHSNGGLGIDLDPDGVTPNDTGDGDTGANNLQNFPVLTSAAGGGTATVVVGTLNSTASTTFTLQFFSNAACDASGYGEGETFELSSTETTDGSGNVSFTVTLGRAVPLGRFITATATDPNDNTSEFSECEQVLLDYDGDGVGDSTDNCPAWPNPGQGLPPWPVPAGDPDCDGFDDTAEGFVGTLPLKQCADDTTVNNEDPDPWPPDFQDNKNVDIFDVLAMKPFFGSPASGNPYRARHDIQGQNGTVDIFDVLAMKPFFAKSCT